MKRLFLGLAILLMCAPALAAPQFWTLSVDNQMVPAEMPPLAVGEGTLLVSARSLFQALKATYDQDPVNGRIKVSRSGAVLEMQEGLAQATINGREVRMPIAPRRESGVLMVPVPFVAELFGYRSSIDAQGLSMTLTTGGTSPASPPPARGIAGVSPVAPVESRGAAPSALAWLAGGNLPSSVGAPPPVGLTMPASAAMPPSMTVSPVLAAQAGSAVMTASSTVPPPSMTLGGAPMASVGTVSGTAPAGYVQMPAGAYQTDYRVAPGARKPVVKEPENPFPDDSGVTVNGVMDFLPNELDLVAETAESDAQVPDPAVTGLTLERRYDQFVTAYTVRYRVSNLSLFPTDRPLMVVLMVGGSGSLQQVQDVKIDRLGTLQSFSFEWTGDARSYTFLNDMGIRVQARISLAEGAADAKADNNTRTVRISF